MILHAQGGQWPPSMAWVLELLFMKCTKLPAKWPFKNKYKYILLQIEVLFYRCVCNRQSYTRTIFTTLCKCGLWLMCVCSYVSSSPGCKIYLSGCVWPYLNTHIFFATWCRFAFESMGKMPRPICTKATYMNIEQPPPPTESVGGNNDNNTSF